MPPDDPTPTEAHGVLAAFRLGYRLGRIYAAEEIAAHAEKHAPLTDTGPSALRRHLHIAARIAHGMPDQAEAFTAWMLGKAVCELDEASIALTWSDTTEEP